MENDFPPRPVAVMTERRSQADNGVRANGNASNELAYPFTYQAPITWTPRPTSGEGNNEQIATIEGSS